MPLKYVVRHPLLHLRILLGLAATAVAEVLDEFRYRCCELAGMLDPGEYTEDDYELARTLIARTANGRTHTQ